MKKVYFMIYDLGAGHRSTANALKEVIERRKLFWEVRIVDVFKEIFDTTIPHYVYNHLVLKRKWAQIINDPILLPLFKLQVRLFQHNWRNRLKKYWREYQPDLVVSLLPHVNRLLNESLQAELPNTPFITSITDFADIPPNFWIETKKQLLICPSQKSVVQAQSCGYSQQEIFHTSGIVIHPQFYQPVKVERSSERQSLGLDPDLPTGLVMFGSHGSKEMIKIAKSLEQSSSHLQLIFICGRNEEVAKCLQNLPTRFPKYVEGFTKQIPYYMDLCDFLIGKPGSVSISEALARKLPVITECNNTTTLFQERPSADWLIDNGFGIVISNFRDINKAVAELIKPENLSTYKKRIETYKNLAVFEVVDILESILHKSDLETTQKIILA